MKDPFLKLSCGQIGHFHWCVVVSLTLDTLLYFTHMHFDNIRRFAFLNTALISASVSSIIQSRYLLPLTSV